MFRVQTTLTDNHSKPAVIILQRFMSVVSLERTAAKQLKDESAQTPPPCGGSAVLHRILEAQQNLIQTQFLLIKCAVASGS